MLLVFDTNRFKLFWTLTIILPNIFLRIVMIFLAAEFSKKCKQIFGGFIEFTFQTPLTLLTNCALICTNIWTQQPCRRTVAQQNQTEKRQPGLPRMKIFLTPWRPFRWQVVCSFQCAFCKTQIKSWVDLSSLVVCLSLRPSRIGDISISANIH